MKVIIESLQRIESAQRIAGIETQSIRSTILDLKADLVQHRQEDRTDFAEIRATAEEHRRAMDNRFAEQTEDRARHLNEQDEKLDALKSISDKAKGAGWVILSILGAIATFLGTALLALFEGWIKIKT